MYKTDRTTAMKDRQKWSGHEGALEQKFVSSYNHAAPVYVKDGIPTKSDIWLKQQSEKVSFDEILQSDSFRIDPTKLVDKNTRELLEKLDYGKKEDGSKITWQDVMRERYEGLSEALHFGLTPVRIEILNDEILNFDKEREKKSAAFDRMSYLEDQIRETQDAISEHGISSKDKIQFQTDLENLQQSLNGLMKEYPVHPTMTREQELEDMDKQKCMKQELLDSLKAESVITNDANRLKSVSAWISGIHTYPLDTNDFRDLSKKMFNATPDQQEMLCSEWAARCISSTADQVSRLTSLDLQSAGIVDEGKEAKVLRNPIPEHEILTKMHPERLVTVLQRSGCVEQIHHEALETIVNVENTSRKAPNISVHEQLPSKMLSLLKAAKSEEEFVDLANKNVAIYLEMAKVNPPEEAKQQLSSLYQAYTKKPEGVIGHIKDTLNNILEFCHIRAKNSKEKEMIAKFIEGVNTGTEKLKQTQLEACVQDTGLQNTLKASSGMVVAVNSAQPSIATVNKKNAPGPNLMK